MSVREFPRGYAVFYAVACSAEELSAIEAVDRRQIERLGTGMQHYLDTHRRIPRIRVVCLGTGTQHSLMPPGIRYWASKPFGGGIWLREMRAAVVAARDGNPIRRVVVHELAHALLDILSKGFPYPIAIQEGFARRAEYFLPDDMGDTEWKRVHSRRCVETSVWNASECMSIAELLRFDPHEHWRQGIAIFLRMTDLAFWLNMYLFRLSTWYPTAKRLLPELRRKNIRTPEGVYEWLQETLCMSADEMENGFRTFCTTGVFPDRFGSPGMGKHE